MAQMIKQKISKNSSKNYSNISHSHLVLYLILGITLNVSTCIIVYLLGRNDGRLALISSLSPILLPVLAICMIITHYVVQKSMDNTILGVPKNNILKTKTNLFTITSSDLFVSIIICFAFTVINLLCGQFTICLVELTFGVLTFVVYEIMYVLLASSNTFRELKAERIINMCLLGCNMDISLENIAKNIGREVIFQIEHKNVTDIQKRINTMTKIALKLPDDSRTKIVKYFSEINATLIENNHFNTLIDISNSVSKMDMMLYHAYLPNMIDTIVSKIDRLDMSGILTFRPINTIYLLTQKLEDKNICQKLALSVYGYYEKIKNNNNLTKENKSNLIKEFLNKLSTFAFVPDVNKNHNIYVILLVIKDLVKESDFETFRVLLDSIYSKYSSDKNSTQLVIISIQMYLYYLFSLGNVCAKEFLQVTPTTKAYTENLSYHMATSKGKYLNQFWKVVYMIENIDLSYLSCDPENDLKLDTAIDYFLSYFKVFAMSNNIISLERDNYPEYYNEILQKMIDYCISNQGTKGETLSKFLSFYDIDFDETNEKYMTSISRIDTYIKDRYVASIFENINLNQSKLNLLGLDRPPNRIMDSIKNNFSKIPFTAACPNDYAANESITKIVDISDLVKPEGMENIINAFTKEYVSNTVDYFKNYLLTKSNFKSVNYYPNRENLKGIADEIKNYNVDTMSTALSSNIIVASNEYEENLQDFINGELRLNNLDIDIGKYFYANSKCIRLYNYPKHCTVADIDMQTITKMLDELKVSGNQYKICGIICTYEEAKDILKNTKKQISLDYHISIDTTLNAGFFINFS